MLVRQTIRYYQNRDKDVKLKTNTSEFWSSNNEPNVETRNQTMGGNNDQMEYNPSQLFFHNPVGSYIQHDHVLIPDLSTMT